MKRNIEHRFQNKPGCWFGGGIKSFSFVLLGVLFSVFLNAQKSLTTSDILASAKNQYLLQIEKQRVDFLMKNNPKLPILDELEFRTETNDFNIVEQEYALRGRFYTKEQRAAQANFNQARIDLRSVEAQILINELLRERYAGIMEVIYFEKLLEAKNEAKILLEDRLTVLKKSINLPRFNILDLIDAEEDLQEVDRDILRLENALNFSQQKINRWIGEEGVLPKENLQLIDIDQVMKLMRSLPNEPSDAHATLVKRNLNATVAVREQAIRNAREENTIEFFQAKIGGTDDSGFRQNFTLGMGMRIPVRNREEIDLYELEFEKIDEQLRAQELRLELKNRMATIRLQMENHYRLYELLQLQIQNSQAENVFQQYQKIAGTSPLALLQLKGNRFKKELELFRMEQAIYILYIELLDASGKMMELPLRNYLMTNQPVF